MISLLPAGEIGSAIERLGIPVLSVNMRRGKAQPLPLARLTRLLRQSDAEIVQTWLYHADLLGALTRPWLGRKTLLWNLRQSELDPRASKLSTRATARVCAALSWIAPRGIVCCSDRARTVHAALGYRKDIMVTIPNGFDLVQFRPDAMARHSLRSELGISSASPVIGLVGRFDPQKDVSNFLLAGRRLQDSNGGVHLVICGREMDHNNSKLSQLVAEAGVPGNLHLLGPRHDTARIMNGLDILVSSSAFGEGFPNVVGEAMACGTPCVVTDVGDSGAIVGDTGFCVPPRQPQALASAIESMLREGSRGLQDRGRRARSRVEENYSIEAIAQRYEAYYASQRPEATP